MKFFEPLQNERGRWPVGDWIQLIVALGPLIIELVKMIESLFHSSTGPEKKQIAMSFAESLLPIGVGDGLVSEEMLSGLIDNSVNLLNRAGVFTHKDPDKPTKPFVSLF